MKIGKLVTGIVLAILAGVVCADGVMAQNMDSVEGDRRALADLYHSTGGDKWKNNSGWLNGNPSNNWHGVQVDGNGRVIKVKLNGTGFGQDGVWGGNNLKGTLPESIGNLTKVTYFNVKHNFLEGGIPSSIGNLENLIRLYLNGEKIEPTAKNNPNHNKHRNFSSTLRTNRFSGALPSSIGKLKNLEYLEIVGIGLKSDTVNDGSGYPGLTGIPSEIGNLTNLKGLYLNFNSIDHLPSSMQNLKELRHLYIGRNALMEMGMPSWLSGLTQMRNLDIEANNMGGAVPDLSGWKDFRFFWGARNNFTGDLPEYLLDGTHANINMLELAWNNFSGSFPEIKTPNNLTAFTIEGNNITGEIHPSWGTSATRKIINFGVGWNNLEGNFPDMIHAYRLRYIRARNNNFTGPLPALHPDNKKLANLWFQNNNFSGPIDPSIAKAVKNGRKSFGDFNISNNRMCSKDLDGVVKSINSLGKKVTFRYGNQRDPICGNISSNANAQSMTGEEANASQQANTAGSEPAALPAETGLNQNYPNPFNPTTQIEYTLSEHQAVSLKVYDMAGRVVAVLADGVKQAGHHTATFRGDNLSSGIYFIRFMAGSQVHTKKMTLVK